MIVSVNEAVERLKAGDVVAFPTETVYGLGADAKNPEAVRKTFQVKGRPADNPLIVHISNMEQAGILSNALPDHFFTLAKTFWPGPLTMVVQKSAVVPDVVSGGLSTVGLRMPDHPLALELISRVGPLTAPSANRSGKPSPTHPRHIEEDYGNELPLVDGGAANIGLESTVIDLTGSVPVILRPGAVSVGMISEQTGIRVQPFSESRKPDAPKSPGVKYTHYKPDASVNWFDRLPASPDSSVLYLFHSRTGYPPEKNICHFHGNFEQMARELFDLFRLADHLRYNQILIEPLPDDQKHPMISPLRNRIEKAIGV